MSGGDTKRRRGGMSRYLNGGENALMRRPPRHRENLEQNGGWSRDQIIRMDSDFVSAVERAIKCGLERRSSAGDQQRPDAGDLDWLAS